MAKLDKPVKALDGLVLQFELKLSEGLTCGGAYLKYLTAGEFEVTGLKDDTPYTVMFGPDKCGSTNKVSSSIAVVPDLTLPLCLALAARLLSGSR